MNAKRYNQVLEDFFKNHAQINTVTTGTAFSLNSKSDILYKVAHIEMLDPSPVTPTTRGFRYLVTIADIFDTNLEESQFDIYSDSIAIAEDCIDYFSNQYEDDYTFVENVRIQRFNNGIADRVCGASFIAEFIEDRLANACAIPYREIPNPNTDFSNYRFPFELGTRPVNPPVNNNFNNYIFPFVLE